MAAILAPESIINSNDVSGVIAENSLGFSVDTGKNDIKAGDSFTIDGVYSVNADGKVNHDELYQLTMADIDPAHEICGECTGVMGFSWCADCWKS